MRGEDSQRLALAELVLGNTPTCVGKTIWHPCIVYLGKKHPHMRGEDHTALGGTQMRVGNTPTCVGKTRPAFVVTVRNWKHPHMRGEDGIPPPISASRPKHPHMRGEDPERSLNFFLHTWY